MMINYGWPRVNEAMSRASFVFSALMVVFAVLFLNSIGDLPAKIAVHFDANSAPDRWVSREQYGIFALLFLIGSFRTTSIGLLTKESSKPKAFCCSIRVGSGQ